MKTLTALFFLACLLPASAPGEDPAPATVSLERETYHTVRTAARFTVGGVGEAGIPSRQETAFRLLLKQPDPVVQCRNLLTEGTPAGQLYGLLGLRLLDQKAFQAALPRYQDSATSIQTMSGCLGFQTTAAKLAKQIEDGTLK